MPQHPSTIPSGWAAAVAHAAAAGGWPAPSPSEGPPPAAAPPAPIYAAPLPDGGVFLSADPGVARVIGSATAEIAAREAALDSFERSMFPELSR